ncbi:hypothetical protein J1N35_012071 [Gossypium stocksii]|uniref:Zinc knuckle CX2CX4HX4C domain-containing protein n=1 Tax=Gossypium stocksii TaxID=47602 RepID=A0A9D3W5L9_9ROSI|nr:hypothetical protein J1N35_012071 [Gossypium stocksii]
MKSTMANLWHPIRGVRILDLGERRFLFQFFHGFYSEALAKQLGDFIGKLLEYDGANMGKGILEFLCKISLKKEKKIMFYGNRSYVKFKYEILTLFGFYCGYLRHSGSFCEAKMALGVEITKMGWDIYLQTQSRKARAQSSVWLREEEEGIRVGYHDGNRSAEGRS